MFVVAIGMAGLVILAFKVGNMSSHRRRRDLLEITANFDNIGGLKPRAAIKSAGVVVGRVTSIELQQRALHERR
jgi:phospholipid/cholesterol/gamma-HCH transport system substrate-binding protein